MLSSFYIEGARDYNKISR